MQLRERVMERTSGFYLDDFESAVLKSLLRRLELAGYGNEREIIDDIESDQLRGCGRTVNAIDEISYAFSKFESRNDEFVQDSTLKDMFRRGAHIGLYALSRSMEAGYFSYVPRFTKSLIRSSPPGPYTKPLVEVLTYYGLPGYQEMFPQTKEVMDALFPRVIPYYLREHATIDELRLPYEVGAGTIFTARSCYDDECDRTFLKAYDDEALFQKFLAKLETEIEQI